MLVIYFRSKREEDGFLELVKNSAIKELDNQLYLRAYDENERKNYQFRNVLNQQVNNSFRVEKKAIWVIFLGSNPEIENFRYLNNIALSKSGLTHYVFDGSLSHFLNKKRVKVKSFFSENIFSSSNYTVIVNSRNERIINSMIDFANLSNEQVLSIFANNREFFEFIPKLRIKNKSKTFSSELISQNFFNKIKAGKTFWHFTYLPLISSYKFKSEINLYARALANIHEVISNPRISSIYSLRVLFNKNFKELRFGFIYAVGDARVSKKFKNYFLNHYANEVSDKLQFQEIEAFENIISKRLEITSVATAEKIFDPDSIPALGQTGKPLVVVFCIDNYTKSTGGVQLFLGTESRKVQSLEGNYLALFPANFSNQLRERTNLVLMLNDEEVTEFSSRYLSDFFNWINSQNSGSEDLMIVSLHSLLGHSAIDLHDALKGRSDYVGNFYIHDYYSFCTSVKLMRNDWQFCGAPPVSSMSCKFCIHGSGRLHHSDQIRLLVELEQIQLLSPSHFVKELWLEKYGQEKEIIVFPHSELNNQQLLERSYANTSPIRIAFVGYPVKAKGWFEFLELVKMNLSEKVSFHVISMENPQIDDVNFVYVAQTSEDVNLTTNALLSSEIDLVFVWPNWPETYSYVTMEALAAGCQIVTNTNSGNVRFLAEQFSASFVYETTEEFQKDLNSGTIRKKLENRDLYKYEHEHGSYLLSFLLEKD